MFCRLQRVRGLLHPHQLLTLITARLDTRRLTVSLINLICPPLTSGEFFSCQMLPDDLRDLPMEDLANGESSPQVGSVSCLMFDPHQTSRTADTRLAFDGLFVRLDQTYQSKD